MRFFVASLFSEMLIVIIIDTHPVDKFMIFTSFRAAVKRVTAAS
jgi:hypothetical protein